MLKPFKTADSLALSSVKIGYSGIDKNKLRLTVFGNISSNNIIYSSDSNSELWESTFSTVFANSAGWGGDVVTQNISGSNIPLGEATNSSLTAGGVFLTLEPKTKVTDAIDQISEVLENIRRGTFVKAVSGVPSKTAIAIAETVNFNASLTGMGVLPVNSTGYVYSLSWGDNTAASKITTVNSTASFTNKTFTTQGYKNLFLSAHHTDGSGLAGSFAVFYLPNAILVYTQDPDAVIELYKALTGGSQITGENRWLVAGETLYVKNTSLFCTELPNLGYGYYIYWDRANLIRSQIDDNGATGGALTSAARISYTYSTPGYFTLSAVIFEHPTANPAVIPRASTGSYNLKVYDSNPATPNNLSTKTMSLNGGTDLLLCSNVSNNGITNHGTAVPAAGSTIKKFGPPEGTTISTNSFASGIAYYETNSTVDAIANEANIFGTRTMTNGSNTNASNSPLYISQDTDYSTPGGSFYNSGGIASLNFASSIYYPGLYRGFVASMNRTRANCPLGINSLQLRYDSSTIDPVSSTKMVFVVEDLNSAPTVNTADATITANTPVLRYITGVPYYNSGTTVDINTLKVSNNWIDQTYYSAANPLTLSQISVGETPSSGNLFSSNPTRTYNDLISVTIPSSGTGKSSSVTLNNQSGITLNGVGSYTSSKITTALRNVINSSGAVNIDNKIIQYHSADPATLSFRDRTVSANSLWGSSTAAQRLSGITELVQYSGGRVYFNNANNVNYFNTNKWGDGVYSNIETTSESIVRYGRLKYFNTDLSSSYLPAGPNFSSRSGLQFYIGALTRTQGYQFNFTITGHLNNFYICAPSITDAGLGSTTNGWLSGTSAYNNTGTPGPNGVYGCANTNNGRVVIPTNTLISGSTYRLTLGDSDLFQSQAQNGGLLLFCVELASSSNYIDSISITQPSGA